MFQPACSISLCLGRTPPAYPHVSVVWRLLFEIVFIFSGDVLSYGKKTGTEEGSDGERKTGDGQEGRGRHAFLSIGRTNSFQDMVVCRALSGTN